MLNVAKVELELISDACKYLFLEKGMVNGTSYISKSIVNLIVIIWNLVTQNNQNIIYFSANNLYGYAMSKLLLTSGFK